MRLLSPTAALPITRTQQPSQYRSAGNTDIIPLGKQNLYRDISLRYTGQITCTAANNTIAKTNKGDEWAAVSRIRLVVNGSDVLFDLSGNDLWYLNYFMFGGTPPVTVALGDYNGAAGTANPAWDSTLVIPVWAMRTIKPMDTAYEAWRVNSLNLEITYQDYTYISDSATAYTANPSIEISTSEVQRTDQFTPQFIGRINKLSVDYSAAQSNARFPLDIGPYYRGMIINTEAQGGGDDLADTLTRVQLVAGSTTLFDQSWRAMLQGSRLYSAGALPTEFKVASNAVGTNIAANSTQRISAGSSPNAWAFMNLCKDGYLSESVSSPIANDLFLNLTTSAACRVNVIQLQLFPNPNVGVAA